MKGNALKFISKQASKAIFDRIQILLILEVIGALNHCYKKEV